MARPVSAAQHIRRVRWVTLFVLMVVLDGVYVPKIMRGEPTGLLSSGGSVKDPKEALIILNLFWVLVLLVALRGTGWFGRGLKVRRP